MSSDVKTYLGITGTIVVLIAIAALVFYFWGKKTNENIVPLPNQTDWGKDLTTDESSEITQYADKLFKDMKGGNFWNRDLTLYSNYLGTSDRVFVGVANYFAKTYGGGDNLAQWIDGEMFWFTNPFDYQTIIPPLAQRLAKFGIIIKA